jgi:DNA-binding transcriptional ArsR family regulator/uncharacterized protein YndB with AHSA1/START domain
MSYQQADNVLDLLGDATRRRILELLRGNPSSVAAIAGALPVSRPAVSKHLRMLKEAGLVTDRAEGTRRIYRLRPEGFRSVVAYWDGFWDETLTRFKEHVEGGIEMTDTQQAIHKEVLIGAAQEDTFRMFTQEMAAWWPFEGKQVIEAAKDAVVIEPFPGGRIYERAVDGREAEWGSVQEYVAPSRLVLRWHPGYGPEQATTVTVDLEAVADDLTRLSLVHDGWEVHGSDAADRAAGYTSGWDVVLSSFAEFAGR